MPQSRFDRYAIRSSISLIVAENDVPRLWVKDSHLWQTVLHDLRSYGLQDDIGTDLLDLKYVWLWLHRKLHEDNSNEEIRELVSAVEFTYQGYLKFSPMPLALMASDPALWEFDPLSVVGSDVEARLRLERYHDATSLQGMFDKEMSPAKYRIRHWTPEEGSCSLRDLVSDEDVDVSFELVELFTPNIISLVMDDSPRGTGSPNHAYVDESDRMQHVARRGM
ncbi:hypothetical protein LTR51_008660 [Lithohypha guttulata]|nr:hypothetical protein LTR51_008660 [Lithohypha guttulata]